MRREKKFGIERGAFATDIAAHRALKAALRRRGVEGYTVVSQHRLRAHQHIIVTLKHHYAGDAQGAGASLKIAAHLALCSAGYR